MVKEIEEKIILSVAPGSPAEAAGILPGDAVAEINGREIVDIFDYRYFICDRDPSVTVIRNGERLVFALSKDEYEDPGFEFKNVMLARDRHCANSCVFCFIDQMPPGMRESLYFKDDDLRLSFLTGNYVTLTNCPVDELKRLAGYHISPVNVSIHTMNPELRVKMLGHKGAGDIAEKLKILMDAGITVNGQIVLVPDWNDKDELRFTLDTLLNYPREFNSLSVVPVGLTKYREGLPKLRPFTKQEAIDTVMLIEDYRKMAVILRGNPFVHASDEFYVKAGLPVPGYDEYDGFPALEDGVGMLRLFESQVDGFLGDGRNLRRAKRRLLFRRSVKGTVVCGTMAYPMISAQAGKLEAFCKSLGKKTEIAVEAVPNDFFGREVTVSGLITGGDLINNLKDKDLPGGCVFIPKCMLRAGENVLLDDVTTDEIGKALGKKIVAVENDGAAFCEAVLYGGGSAGSQKR